MKRLLALAAALSLLAVGCAALPTSASASPLALPVSTPTDSSVEQEEGLTPEQLSMGSVGLLSQPTVLVSVYVNSGGQSWSDEDIEKSRQNLKLAAEWIETQAAQYGTQTTLYYDDGTHDDLRLSKAWARGFIGGEDADEGSVFYETADLWSAALDTEALQAAYGTDRVGFLYFIPTVGCDHTLIHYSEYEEYYYYEYCVLYRDDIFGEEGEFDGPTAYAHELLHLFGAVDLYDGSPAWDVTPELVAHVQENWPDAVMMDVYEEDGSIDYESINKSICPATAFRLGLAASFEGQQQFPQFAAASPGVVEYGYDELYSYGYGEEGDAPQQTATPGPWSYFPSIACRPAG